MRLDNSSTYMGCYTFEYFISYFFNIYIFFFRFENIKYGKCVIYLLLLKNSRTHHDYIPHQEERQCGPRILTFFLYLSDVIEGGGTNFPQLDITIEPKRGRALVWPSVYNHNPMKKDPRMMHQALEVLNGTKYAANGWIHMYDYVTPQANGCT